MTLDIWLKEVRRLVLALAGPDAAHVALRPVELQHVIEVDPKTKQERPAWLASCWGCSRVTGETSDGVMRALLATLQASLAERIRKQKLELERLERSAAFTLRAVPPS